MFNSITFHSNPYFGCCTIFVYFNLYPVRICYAIRFVCFTVPSGRRGALFLLRRQIYKSGSAFIKKIESFFYHCISMPR